MASTMTVNFQFSIEVDGELTMEQCIRDFNEMVEEFRKVVMVRTCTVSVNDQRRYDDIFCEEAKE